MLAMLSLVTASCATVPGKKLSAMLDDSRRVETSSDDQRDHYLLGPDDVIRVTVENHPEWSGEFTIKPDGKMFITDLGDFMPEGLSRDDFTVAFTNEMSSYINNPRVTVDIVKYASQVVYVFGAVAQPGKYPTEGKKMTIRDAILAAGLPTTLAAIDRVFVISGSRKSPTRQVVNLYRVLYRGELKRNIELRPGDIVYVPLTLIGKITELLQAVISPLGSFGTARQAISPIP